MLTYIYKRVRARDCHVVLFYARYIVYVYLHSRAYIKGAARYLRYPFAKETNAARLFRLANVYRYIARAHTSRMIVNLVDANECRRR